MTALSRLVMTVFVQMLPATVVAPAVRPLFAQMHGGNEGGMHAFMAINMGGALIAAPLVGVIADRRGIGKWAIAALCLADAILLSSFAVARDLSTVLLLRFVEGGVHVGAATMLLAHAAVLARSSGRGSIMGMAGGAIMFAVATGSALGGTVVDVDPRLPFLLAGAVALVAAALLAAGGAEAGAGAPRPRGVGWTDLMRRHRALWAPVTAAFVARFTVGALIVTFALFAHHAHGLADSTIGALFAALTFGFALATYPMGKLCERIGAARVLGAGAVVYAACLLALGATPPAGLVVVMGLAGLASAAMFAPILSYAALLGTSERRATAMSLVNAAGCLGMLLGPATAGVVSHLAGRADPVAGYRTVFWLASGAVVLWVAVAARWLWARTRQEQVVLV